MTDEEIAKYANLKPANKQEDKVFTDYGHIKNAERNLREERKDENMPKRAPRPTNEELAKLCQGYPTVYAASKALVDKLGVSRSCITRWITEAGIKIGQDSHMETPVVMSKDGEQGPNLTIEREYSASIQSSTEIITNAAKALDSFAVAVEPVLEEKSIEINIESEIKVSLSMATYQVGQVLVIVNFQEEIIRFLKSDMTFKEAAAVIQLLDEIL
jgi:hypothetical protein